MRPPVVDAHVHFWDPAELRYPWLDGNAALRRAFLPSDYATATLEIPVAKMVVVEGNCGPEQAQQEVEFVERLAQVEPRIAGIVAFADLANNGGREALDRMLEALTRSSRVKGIRQNIQGQPSGFCLRRAFIEGVRQVGRRGLTFDLCATHDQLSEVTELVRQCPNTRFVLDHCGKPAIRGRRVEPWDMDIARLSAYANVSCKLSGLLTQANPDRWTDEDLFPYAARVLECFGRDRVMYGSDWPVHTLAGSAFDWYSFTDKVTAGWSAVERGRFYAVTAVRVYGL